MARTLAFLYGTVSYLIFFITFLYAIGFVGNLVVPEVDRHPADGGDIHPRADRERHPDVDLRPPAQHHGPARFQTGLDALRPKPVERSTYVLAASLALILLFWQWRAMPELVWNVENAIGQYVLWALFSSAGGPFC